MRLARRAWCRAYQTAFRIALPVLPYFEPQVADTVEKVPELLAKHGVTTALLVTDPGVARLGLTHGLEDALAAAGIACEVYDRTVANPTIANVEKAAAIYRERGCGAIIGFGGGSAMDCAKGVGARIAQPAKPIQKMRGLLRVHRALPPLVAVPTTAGTGSEVTLAAVITPAAKPSMVRWNWGRGSSTKKNTTAAPKVVIRKVKPVPKAAQLNACSIRINAFSSIQAEFCLYASIGDNSRMCADGVCRRRGLPFSRRRGIIKP